MTPADFLALAASVVGLSAAPATLESYQSLLAGDVEPQTFLDWIAAPDPLHKRSDCALVVRGLLREAGVDEPELTHPYRIGRAVSDVVEIGKRRGAWLPAGTEPRPLLLFVLEGPEHVGLVTGVEGNTVISIDGGQRDPNGYEAIHVCKRPLIGGRLAGRVVTEWFCVEKMIAG